MHEIIPDQWSLDNNLWKPKQQIGEYVESMDERVPMRFTDIDEALGWASQGSNRTFIIRSEHPFEYEGPSGILDSYRIYKERGPSIFTDELNGSIDDVIAEASVDPFEHIGMRDYELADIVMSDIFETDSSVSMDRLTRLALASLELQSYARLNGLAREDLAEELSFSFWEYIPGANITMVADDLVDDRYHILTDGGALSPKNNAVDGLITNGRGDNLWQSVYSRFDHSAETLQEVIAKYEALRNLPMFNSEHCPLMELQLDMVGNIWFLQYHRSRDKGLQPDLLTSGSCPQIDGWIDAGLSRGSLGEEPQKLEVIMLNQRPDEEGYVATDQISLGDAMFNRSTMGTALQESTARRLLFNMSYEDPHTIYVNIAAEHGDRSPWFKPRAAAAFGYPLQEIVSSGSISKGLSIARRENRMAKLAIEYVSDGLTGFMRVDPEDEGLVVF